jgi:hypothetical protein
MRALSCTLLLDCSTLKISKGCHDNWKRSAASFTLQAILKGYYDSQKEVQFTPEGLSFRLGTAEESPDFVICDDLLQKVCIFICCTD